jgi:LmbE family N-acetylglucosaminyl deacetylase
MLATVHTSTTAFDPTQPGTPEPTWRAALDPVPVWMPDTSHLLVVSPHPDDEVLGAGGLMCEWALAGKTVTLVSITDGEAAHPEWPGLGQVRCAELERALQTLCGLRCRWIRLSLPDGRVAAYDDALRRALAPLLSLRTTLIAPYELDGHPDHDTAGEVCCALAKEKHVPLARYPIWAWHRLAPETMSVRWGKFPLRAAAVRAKADAALCFTSQLSPRDRVPIVPPHVLAYFSRPYEAYILDAAHAAT